MDVVEQMQENLRRELIANFVTKETMDSLEYRSNRKLNDVERAGHLHATDIAYLRTELTHQNMNVNELKAQVFDQNSLVDDLGTQMSSLQFQLTKHSQLYELGIKSVGLAAGDGGSRPVAEGASRIGTTESLQLLAPSTTAQNFAYQPSATVNSAIVQNSVAFIELVARVEKLEQTMNIQKKLVESFKLQSTKHNDTVRRVVATLQTFESKIDTASFDTF